MRNLAQLLADRLIAAQRAGEFADGGLARRSPARQTTSEHWLHVDIEGFQEFRGHDVEPDGELQLDQRARGSVFAAIALNVASVGRRNLTISSVKASAARSTSLKAIGLLPVLQRLVLRVGDADHSCRSALGDDLIRRLAENPVRVIASSRTTGSSSPLWRIAPPSRQYCSRWLAECAIIRQMLALRFLPRSSRVRSLALAGS